ncbi:hypothetical protein GQF03_16310 [Sneathiella chungangensis]|uniref:Uncharacterized protein n=1 Tax=Sneathiella chungangensis TaxID=1418234 RepID=A0A845MJJ7_9PROT|nr:hypothetical protein [Sneathiella chungangensis]MZR23901.1 hypothetical protein [Sneathiella chungangensis]
MVKKNIDGKGLFSVSRTGSFYTNESIMKIIDGVGSDISTSNQIILQNKLELAAEGWSIEDYLQRQPTSKMMLKKLEKIEKSAALLLKSLGSTNSGSISGMSPALLQNFQIAAGEKARRLGNSRIGQLRKEISGIVQIRRWALKVINTENGKQLAGENLAPPNVGDIALKKWILELATIYKDVGWGDPGISLSPVTLEYGGPFFRFVVLSSEGIVPLNVNIGKFIRRSLQRKDKLEN